VANVRVDPKITSVEVIVNVVGCVLCWTVATIDVVEPETKLAEAVGVNVAVIVDVPAPATVAVLTLNESTDGDEDE
jgi:hypothetical protein